MNNSIVPPSADKSIEEIIADIGDDCALAWVKVNGWPFPFRTPEAKQFSRWMRYHTCHLESCSVCSRKRNTRKAKRLCRRGRESCPELFAVTVNLGHIRGDRINEASFLRVFRQADRLFDKLKASPMVRGVIRKVEFFVEKPRGDCPLYGLLTHVHLTLWVRKGIGEKTIETKLIRRKVEKNGETKVKISRCMDYEREGFERGEKSYEDWVDYFGKEMVNCKDVAGVDAVMKMVDVEAKLKAKAKLNAKGKLKAKGYRFRALRCGGVFHGNSKKEQIVSRIVKAQFPYGNKD